MSKCVGLGVGRGRIVGGARFPLMGVGGVTRSRAGWCQCWVQHVTVTNASGELSPPAPASAAWPEGPKVLLFE